MQISTNKLTEFMKKYKITIAEISEILLFNTPTMQMLLKEKILYLNNDQMERFILAFGVIDAVPMIKAVEVLTNDNYFYQ